MFTVCYLVSVACITVVVRNKYSPTTTQVKIPVS